jgi:hypothetical protein
VRDVKSGRGIVNQEGGGWAGVSKQIHSIAFHGEIDTSNEMDLSNALKKLAHSDRQTETLPWLIRWRISREDIFKTLPVTSSLSFVSFNDYRRIFV